jgi:malate dehydrogenase (oxaloacetate-decarboxylating)
MCSKFYGTGRAQRTAHDKKIGSITVISQVLPEFFTAAARAVSDCVTREAMAGGALLPPVTELVNVSLKVGQAVGECAIMQGVSRPCAFSTFQHQQDPIRLKTLIRKMRWIPDYLPLIAM